MIGLLVPLGDGLRDTRWRRAVRGELSACSDDDNARLCGENMLLCDAAAVAISTVPMVMHVLVIVLLAN